jgi:hypothetical protein
VHAWPVGSCGAQLLLWQNWPIPQSGSLTQLPMEPLVLLLVEAALLLDDALLVDIMQVIVIVLQSIMRHWSSVAHGPSPSA